LKIAGGRFGEPEIAGNSQNESAGQRTNEFHRFIPFLGFLNPSGFFFLNQCSSRFGKSGSDYHKTF
jgi:hypothetical protein